MLFRKKELNSLPSRTRANLINKMAGFKSPVLVGTINKKGQNNLSVVSSLVHLGSSPALLGMNLRPKTKKYSHTLKNIESEKQYTVSFIDKTIYKKSHLCSAKLAVNESEFQYSGLTPEFNKDENWSTPHVAESKIQIGLELSDNFKLKNKCSFIVGEINWIKISDELLENKFELKPLVNHVSILGLYEYYEVNFIEKLMYVNID
tara:strand:- start:677 stop:1291 length:615 start_codon:yes stop_codon:yes gene_type:complete